MSSRRPCQRTPANQKHRLAQDFHPSLFLYNPSGAPPGTKMQMLAPFNKIWSSLVTLRPSGVCSLWVKTRQRKVVTKNRVFPVSHFRNVLQNHVDVVIKAQKSPDKFLF